MHHGHDVGTCSRSSAAGRRDVELIVPLAEQDFGDLDVVESDATRDRHQSRAVLIFADIDGQAAAAASAIRIHAQAGDVDRRAERDDLVEPRIQSRRFHPADVVRAAGVVEHVETIGLLRFIGRYGDINRQAGDFGRQHNGRLDRPVAPFQDATFDDQRPADSAGEMFAHRLVADKLPFGIGNEIRVRRQRNANLRGPVAGVKRHGKRLALQRQLRIGRRSHVGIGCQSQHAADHRVPIHLVGDVVDLKQRRTAIDGEERADLESIGRPTRTRSGDRVGG